MPRKTIMQIQIEHAEAISHRDEQITELKAELRRAEKSGDQARCDLRSAEVRLTHAEERIMRGDRAYAALRGAFLIIDGGGPDKLAKIEKADTNFIHDDEIPF